MEYSRSLLQKISLLILAIAVIAQSAPAAMQIRKSDGGSFNAPKTERRSSSQPKTDLDDFELVNAVIGDKKGSKMSQIEELCAKGADPNAFVVVNKERLSALAAASLTGKPELIKYLVESCGAKVEKIIDFPYLGQVAHGDYCVRRAVMRSDIYSVAALSEYMPSLDASELVSLAITSYASTEMLEFLVDNGADLTKDETICLAVKSSERSTDIVKFLLEKGANPNATCKDGSLMDVALKKGNADVIRLIKNKME